MVVVECVCGRLAAKGTIVLKMNKTLVILLVLIGLLGISSVALAGHEDGHAEDTKFSFGYDNANHLLALNSGPNYEPYDCKFQNGTLTATYGAETADGVIPVDELDLTGGTADDGTSTKEFDARLEEDLPEGEFVATPATIAYGTPDLCVVSGVIVAGPNGQINHGQFMKAAKSLFNSLYDIKGQGCIVRHLAKSSIGKGNDPSHLTVSEAETLGFEFGGAGTFGDIDFTTVEADCDRGKKDKGDTTATASSGKTKGKSADAPGRNK